RFSYEQSWNERIENILKEVQKAVPEKETILLVDNDWFINSNGFSEHRFLPFLEKNNEAWGPPPDDEVAIRELNRMRKEKQAGFIAIAWPSFWWFDVYPDFIQYLRDNFDSLVENEDVVVFNLCEKITIPLKVAASANVIMHE